MPTTESFDLVIRGARLVSGEGITASDIGIRGGKIAELGDLSGASAVEVIEALGLHALPGAIDTQVHFREPGMEHKEDLESGSRAALMGGVTTYFEMPNTKPTTTTKEALADKLARAEGRSWVNYAFFVGAATDNIGQLPALELAAGSPGIKIFMGSSTGSLLVDKDEDLRQVLKAGRFRAAIHAEDEQRLRERRPMLDGEPHVRMHPEWRDAEAARLATERILALSKETSRPVHVLHISTQDELPLLAEAKKQGLGTTCEVTPQHLTFQSSAYERLGTFAQMNPPIRSEEHRAAIFKAWKDGLFDVMGSDHAPHTLEEKALPYPQSPSGMPGVQTLLPSALRWVHSGDISLPRAVQMLCENPAKLYGLQGKGAIKVGYDADIVLLDPAQMFKVSGDWLESKCGWSPFEGMFLHGRPVFVTIMGKVAVRDGARVGTPQGQMASFTWK